MQQTDYEQMELGNIIGGQILEMTNKNGSYWVKRAKKVGFSDYDITQLACKDAGALPQEVVKKEKELRVAKKKESYDRYVSVEGSSLECSYVFATDSADHKLEVRHIKLRNGKYVDIYAHKKFGQPRERDLNILLALFKIGNKNRYKEYKATKNDIKEELNYERGGLLDEDIGESMARLAACFVQTNNWWDANKKRRVVAGFNFLQNYSYDKIDDEYNIRFSEWVEKNIEKKYLKKIDYIVATKELKGCAKIVYLNLVKMIGKKQYFEVLEETILRWVGRWERYQKMSKKVRNKNIKRSIDVMVKKVVKMMNLHCKKVDGKFLIKATPFTDA